MKINFFSTGVFIALTLTFVAQLQFSRAADDPFAKPSIFNSPGADSATKGAGGPTAGANPGGPSAPATAPAASATKNPNMPREVFLDSQTEVGDVRRPADARDDDDADDQRDSPRGRRSTNHSKAKRGRDAGDDEPTGRRPRSGDADGDFINVD